MCGTPPVPFVSHLSGGATAHDVWIRILNKTHTISLLKIKNCTSIVMSGHEHNKVSLQLSKTTDIQVPGVQMTT